MSRGSASSVSVYAGRTCLGSVQRRGDGYVAVDVNGVVIGAFTSMREAANAISGDGEKTCS